MERVSGRSGSLSYHYQSSDGHLSEVTDQSGRKVGLAYELGRLKQAANAMGEAYIYLYDDKKSIQKIRNPRGISVLDNEYDREGRTIRQHFADGGVIKFDYQDSDNKTLVTDQNGNRVAYVHDERFRNIKTIYLDGEESFTYNDRNQMVSKTDKNGNTPNFFMIIREILLRLSFRTVLSII